MEMGRNLEAKQLELNLIKDSLGCLVHPKMLQIVPFSCKKSQQQLLLKEWEREKKIGTEQKVFLLLLLFFSLCDIISKLESQQKLFVRFLAERKS